MRQRFAKPAGQAFVLTGSPVRDVIEIGRWGAAPIAFTQMPPHRHDAGRLEIVWQDSAHRTQKVNGRIYTIRPRQALMVLPGDLHDAADLPEEKAERCYLVLRVRARQTSFLALKGADATTLLRALLRPRHRHFTLSPKAFFLVHELFAYLPEWEQRKRTDPLASLRVEVLVEAFLLELIRCANRGLSGSRSRWAKDMMNHLEANLAQRLRVADLAGHARMSGIGLQCRFKRECGMTLSHAIARLRVERAKGMLLGPDATMTDIALATGFSSSQHFSVFFRRHVGLTPRDYRRLHRPAPHPLSSQRR